MHVQRALDKYSRLGDAKQRSAAATIKSHSLNERAAAAARPTMRATLGLRQHVHRTRDSAVCFIPSTAPQTLEFPCAASGGTAARLASNPVDASQSRQGKTGRSPFPLLLPFRIERFPRCIESINS